MSTVIGVDFGLSVTDAVLVSTGRETEHNASLVTAHAALHRPGVASEEVLKRALSELHLPEGDHTTTVSVTGGRSRELPASFGGMNVVQVQETSAIGRGGLALSGVPNALVVSCGTGTAMIAADASVSRFTHLSGTAVGGGTLEGLAAHLLGLRNASAVAALALSGNAAGVDTTLEEVLGGGVGDLPPSATAVNLGRLADLTEPDPADLAAGLVTMVAQTIALIALNAARAAGLPEIVFIGRLAEFPAMQSVIHDVFALYGSPAPRFPAGAAYATALGAALAAKADRS